MPWHELKRKSGEEKNRHVSLSRARQSGPHADLLEKSHLDGIRV
jgi:hypothetical protein